MDNKPEEQIPPPQPAPEQPVKQRKPLSLIKKIVIVVFCVVSSFGLYDTFFPSTPENMGLVPPPSPTAAAVITPTSATALAKQIKQIKIAPEGVVQRFYDSYLTCAADHFKNKSKKTVREDCLLNNPLVTADLPEKTKNDQIDSVLCAQDIPPSVEVENAVISGDQVTVVVHEKFSPEKQVSVLLDVVNGQWKVKDVTCR